MARRSKANEGSHLSTVIESVLTDEGREICDVSGTFTISRLAEAGRDKTCRDVAFCEQCGGSISTNIRGQLIHLATTMHLTALAACAERKLTGCDNAIPKTAIRDYLASFVADDSSDSDSVGSDDDDTPVRCVARNKKKKAGGKKSTSPRKSRKLDPDAEHLIRKFKIMVQVYS
jgi:hypothetical protein